MLNGTSGTAELAFDLASIARRLAQAAPPAIEAPVPTPGKYRLLLGIYTRPDLGGWMLRLEWRDGKLTFVAPDVPLWRPVLEPTSNPGRPDRWWCGRDDSDQPRWAWSETLKATSPCSFTCASSALSPSTAAAVTSMKTRAPPSSTT